MLKYLDKLDLAITWEKFSTGKAGSLFCTVGTLPI